MQQTLLPGSLERKIAKNRPFVKVGVIADYY
jgi:hypothetical protein